MRKPAVAAYDTADADGRVSAFAPSAPQVRASADQVVETIGADTDDVVLSDRYDLFAFHGYWTSVSSPAATPIHTHNLTSAPNWSSRWVMPTRPHTARTHVLEQHPAHRLARAVARRRGSWVYRYRADNHPDGTTPHTVVFQASALVDDGLFTTSHLLRTLVVAAKNCG